MKKRFKLLRRGCRIYILRWVSEGKLFGADWEVIGRFHNDSDNFNRCRQIIRLMNQCDMHTNHHDDDRE